MKTKYTFIIGVMLVIILALAWSNADAQTYTLTGNMCGTGLTGDTVACQGGLITESYPAGTVVTLTPSPRTGFVFTGWYGAGLWGNKATKLIMNGDKEVTAIYEPIIKRKLYVIYYGTGSGTVKSSPAGIDCGGACVGEFVEDSKIMLTATPEAGSVFKGWRPTTLTCSGTLPCKISMTKAKIATALFDKQ